MIGSALTPDTKSSFAGSGYPCDNIQKWSLLWELKLGVQKSPLEGNEGDPQLQLRSLSVNTKAAVTLVLGIALGYSSPLQQGNGLKPRILYPWTTSMRNVAWKHCGIALASSEGLVTS